MVPIGAHCCFLVCSRQWLFGRNQEVTGSHHFQVATVRPLRNLNCCILFCVHSIVLLLCVIKFNYLSLGSTRRVHISQSTLECLRGEFEVEPGNGGDRCEYLRERGIDTYLVVVSKASLSKNGINGVVSFILQLQSSYFYSSTQRSESVNNAFSSSVFLLYVFYSMDSIQKLSVTSSNGNSPLLINTTECNGSVHTGCTTPEEPEELDTRVQMLFFKYNTSTVV